jgi:DNA primase
VSHPAGTLGGMGILDEDVVAVRDASDMVAVVSQYVQLKRVGRRWQGLCPFHAEKSPSFSVNAEEHFFMCFGCQQKGDVITFVREMEHLDFVGAVEWLAAKSGYTLRYTDRQQGEGRKRRTRLVDAMVRAVDWYHERLLSSDDASKARGYLRSRGIDGDAARAYKIGWAPDDWDAASKALALPADVLRDTGLGFVNRRNRPQDTFRARILFPIFDPQGDPIGFGGRVLPGASDPAKYKNTPETPLYAKSKVLYGLNWAKSGMVAADTAVVCEGYTDVIGMARSGVESAVATCGTALTEEHVRLLRRYAKRFVLAFDADSAGQAAADRFYAWEKAHDLEVFVAALPSGVDPGDLAQRDASALQAAVGGAIPFLRYRVDRVLAAGDLSSPEGRARAAETAAAAIAEHPDPLVRDQYALDVAARCRVDADRLRAAASRRGDVAGRAVAVLPRPAARHDSPELEALRHAVHAPEKIAEWLDESLFHDDLHAEVYRALAAADTVQDALDASPPEAADLLARLIVEDTDSDPVDAAFRLLTEAARRKIETLKVQALASDDAEQANEALRTQHWLNNVINEMRDRAAGVTAATQLLAWLALEGQEGA